MIQENIKDYLQPVFNTLYEAYYQELASESLIERWERIDLITAFLVAATTSGSAIAGWALWNTPTFKYVWAIIAAIASVASIAHGVIKVPTRVKEQEELRRIFAELRVDLETFWQQLRIGNIDNNTVRDKYEKLRERLSQCIGRTHPDIAYTIGFRKKIQDHLNKKLNDKGYIA